MYQYGSTMRLPTCTHVCSVLYPIKQSSTDHRVLKIMLTCRPNFRHLETNICNITKIEMQKYVITKHVFSHFMYKTFYALILAHICLSMLLVF